MNIEILIAGLSLGLISSFHCVGMCGPIAFALPVQHLSSLSRHLAIINYHLGRVLTYSILGAIFGIMGRQIYLAGFQQWFSIVLGVVVLFLLIGYGSSRTRIQPSIFKKLQYKVQEWMAMLLKDSRPGAFLFLGMANGLLPCGMVYLAIAGALSSSEITDGILFMAAFGSGTLPAMVALSMFGHLASISMRNNIRKLTPYVIATMGILLILRGLNLGIPFISPVLEAARPESAICH